MAGERWRSQPTVRSPQTMDLTVRRIAERECGLLRVAVEVATGNRYRAGSGFVNPSVCCADLYRLIGRIRGRLAADIKLLWVARGVR